MGFTGVVFGGFVWVLVLVGDFCLLSRGFCFVGFVLVIFVMVFSGG